MLIFACVGKSNSTKVFQINILVAAKLARVHANQRHETRHETQEAVRGKTWKYNARAFKRAIRFRDEMKHHSDFSKASTVAC